MDQSMCVGGLACVKKTTSPCCQSYNNLCVCVWGGGGEGGCFSAKDVLKLYISFCLNSTFPQVQYYIFCQDSVVLMGW